VPVRNSAYEIIGLCGTARDISRTKTLEAQLRQSQKMEAIGTLAGGIAHDFNNILASIMGYAEIALYKKLPEDSPARYSLEQVLKASRRARDLVKQILTFSRQSEQEKKPLQVVSVIEDVLKFLRASLPSTIEIRESLNSPSGTILADASQIDQLMLNLCSNSAYAMSENGGILEVGLAEVRFGPADMLPDPDLKPGHYIRLTVRDTGAGIPPDITDRIFDPFFTMKGPGEGTGLGLSVVYGIVKDHGGTITVTSNPGEGTTVDVFFPVLKAMAKPEADSLTVLPKGNGKILFVDDEESIVEIQKETLEFLGYNVVETTSSTRALQLFRDNPDRFDIVITDQTMPEMTGTELARRITEVKPDIPIILCTGFSLGIPQEKLNTSGVRDVLFKPIRTSDLASAIQKLLRK